MGVTVADKWDIYIYIKVGIWKWEMSVGGEAKSLNYYQY